MFRYLAIIIIKNLHEMIREIVINNLSSINSYYKHYITENSNIS